MSVFTKKYTGDYHHLVAGPQDKIHAYWLKKLTAVYEGLTTLSQRNIASDSF